MKYSDTISESYIKYSRRSGSMKRRKTKIMRKRRRRAREEFNRKEFFMRSFAGSIKRAVQSGLRTITTPIRRVASSVGSSVRRVGNRIKRGVTNSIRRVGSSLKRVGNRIKSGLTRSVRSVGSGLRRVGSRVKNSVLGTMKRLGRGIKRGVRSVGSGISRTVRSVGSGLSRFGKRVGKGISGGLRRLGGSLKRVGKSVGSGMLRFARKVGTTVGKVGRKIGKAVSTVVKKVSKGVWKALKWIGSMTKKVLNKVFKFFGKIWNFIKKIIFNSLSKLWWPFTSFFKFIKFLLSRIVQFGLAVFLGPLGQLIVRNVFLNGSLDKQWLMYIPIPPFTLIGGWYFLVGAVKKGTGPRTMDMLGIILSLASGVLPWLVNLIIPSSNYMYAIIYPLLLYTYYVFMFYRRDRDRCKKEGFKLGKLLRSANSMSLIAGIIMPLICMSVSCAASGLLGDGNVYVKMRLQHLGLLKFYLFFSVIFGVSGYLITNMKNNSNKYCKPYPVKKASKSAITTIGLLIIWNMFELIISNINCPDGEC